MLAEDGVAFNTHASAILFFESDAKTPCPSFLMASFSLAVLPSLSIVINVLTELAEGI